MNFDELKGKSKDLNKRHLELHRFLKIDERKKVMEEIEKKMSAPDFWDNKEKAQEIMANLSSNKNIIEPLRKLKGLVDDFSALSELVLESNDESMLEETESEYNSIIKELESLELLSFLSGRFDHNNAYFSIHAGAGGTESCDWASMLARMYRRWFERRGFSAAIIDSQPGDEAGYKSITFHVKGEFVYGYSKAEIGIHRLVRISPFDSNARRHTSFASVDVFPEIDDDIDIDIDEKDLKVDTFRASGAGGQHVNTTDSAIRITHMPSGIVVACQAERSQHKNRATAMKMLKAKLFEKKELERKKQADEIRGEKTEMGWGNQIRSYVLHPYQMVKDLRTSAETGNTAAVLDGDIDKFIEAWLRWERE
jgi:peptide chain release factor 2